MSLIVEFIMFNKLPSPTIELLERETDSVSGKRFYKNINRRYPSITTVLSSFSKPQLENWKKRVGTQHSNNVSSRARMRGEQVHSLIESYLNNTPRKTLLKDLRIDLKESFFKVESTLKNNINNIEISEGYLYSDKLKVAGTVDLIAEWNGIRSVIDFKTSLREKNEEYIHDYFLQATAYSLMYEELVNKSCEQIVILIVCDDSNFPQIFVKNREEYVDQLKEKIDSYYKENI